MEYPIIDTVKSLLSKELTEIEDHLKADVLTYYGPIFDGMEGAFLQLIEQLCRGKSGNCPPFLS
ncbi:MAG TPA: hypothetical protein DEQ14_00980 [Treponema sp.]|nr:hypothetical protein [Treponema sp.]